MANRRFGRLFDSRMQNAPPLQHSLSCPYAGTAAKTEALGKRALSNEYLHCRRRDGFGMSVCLRRIIIRRRRGRMRGHVLFVQDGGVVDQVALGVVMAGGGGVPRPANPSAETWA